MCASASPTAPSSRRLPASSTAGKGAGRPAGSEGPTTTAAAARGRPPAAHPPGACAQLPALGATPPPSPPLAPPHPPRPAPASRAAHPGHPVGRARRLAAARRWPAVPAALVGAGATGAAGREGGPVRGACRRCRKENGPAQRGVAGSESRGAALAPALAACWPACSAAAHEAASLAAVYPPSGACWPCCPRAGPAPPAWRPQAAPPLPPTTAISPARWLPRPP